MAAEAATNPTTEGNREHTYKYLNSTECQTDMIVNMLRGIKKIQHEMPLKLDYWTVRMMTSTSEL
eukprot:scaffold10879_cov128-Skeletonema_dohrnii-CCMP3373.AAC.1